MWVSADAILRRIAVQEVKTWTSEHDAVRDLMESVPDRAGGLSGLSELTGTDEYGHVITTDYYGYRRGYIREGRRAIELERDARPNRRPPNYSKRPIAPRPSPSDNAEDS